MSEQNYTTQITNPKNVSAGVLQQLQFEWLARLSRLNGSACIIVDTDMNVVFYEKHILDMLEFEPTDNLTGSSILTIISKLAERGDFGPGDKAVFTKLLESEIRRELHEGDPETKGLTLITPLGRRLYFKQDRDLDGYFLIQCRDITDEHVKRHALRVALDSSVSGYVTYNVETQKYEMHGQAGKKALGDVMTKRLLEKGLRGVAHPSDIKMIYNDWNKGIENKEPWSTTFRIVDPDGKTRWIRSQATPQLSENGTVKVVIYFYTEVTSQLRIQDDLRQAIQQAEKSLSAKNGFLARLSHEIRTPMNAVVGIADALIHHNGDPKIIPKLELIQTSAEKIVRIVDDSLQHTKLAESKLELDPVSASPREAVEAVCSLWEQQAVKNEITLRCRIDESVPDKIIFDSYRYEQCLNNLISNAVKFSPGGAIDVVLTTIGSPEKKRLVVAVKDTGIGMNDAQLGSLFEAFKQADKSISSRFGGTGLGMNITKQIIELMGGSVTAKSKTGEGTVIALTLPILEDLRVADRRETTSTLVANMLEEAVPPKSDYADLRVLVVDDNSTNHMVVCSLLDTLVGHIEVAENGEEAIAILEQQEFDVVLMDIHMPIMDGIEATLAIRSSQTPYTDVPIIALTADPQYQQKRLCKNIGMDDALGKPVKLTELLGAFDRLAVRDVGKEIAA